jgi:hypothetical protein
MQLLQAFVILHHVPTETTYPTLYCLLFTLFLPYSNIDNNG